MRNNFCVLLMILISVFSCKKEDSNSNNFHQSFGSGNPNPGCDHHTGNFGATIPFNSNDLGYCKYKTNSYWVYIDSIDNSIDSQFVKSFEETLIPSCFVKYEGFSFQVSSNKIKESSYYVTDYGFFKRSSNALSRATPIYFRLDSMYYNPFQFINKFDSLFIFDKYYYNVQRKEMANDITEKNRKSIYYVNSEFGILRLDIYWHDILLSKKVLMRKNIVR